MMIKFSPYFTKEFFRNVSEKADHERIRITMFNMIAELLSKKLKIPRINEIFLHQLGEFAR